MTRWGSRDPVVRLVLVAVLGIGLVVGGSVVVEVALLANESPDESSRFPDPGSVENVTVEPENDLVYVALERLFPGRGTELDRSSIEGWIHRLVNERRVENGRAPVEFDRDLQAVARYHSTGMARDGRIYHVSPAGETPDDRYRRFGYTCRVRVSSNDYLTSGENAASTYYDRFVSREWADGVVVYRTERDVAAGIVEGWMQSDSHRENLLDPNWRHEAIGVVLVGKKVYATQNFC